MSTSYLELLALVAPVFLVIFAGMGLRWKGILRPETEKGIVGLVVRFLYPCLIVHSLISADSFRGSPGVLWAPFVGALSISLGFGIAYLVGKLLGMKQGKGLRTFAFSVGIFNYGYIPIPLVQGMFGSNELAALFVHNVGVEMAIWTVGIAMLAGASLKDGLKQIANPMVFSLIVGLSLNLTGWSEFLPAPLVSALQMFAVCAVPLGLIAIGGNLYEFTSTNERLWDLRDVVLGVALRLGVLPLITLFALKYISFPVELQRVLAIQLAMPAGIMPIVLAKHYKGQPVVALRVVVATTIAGIFTMPLWISLALKWVG